MKIYKRHKKKITLLLLLTILTVGMSIAYLTSRSSIDNQFTLGNVDAEIIETFDGVVKKDVKIRNNGEAPAYLRCKIAVYYEMNANNDHCISTNIPVEGSDYSIKFAENFDINWFKVDDIYYYKYPVDKGEEIAFIEECKEKMKKENEKLVVDISVQAIQSTPMEAVTDAWKKVVVDKDTKQLKEGTANGN